MTTASRKCSRERPLFWEIRINPWSRISFPPAFFTGTSTCPARSPSARLFSVEGQADSGQWAGTPILEPKNHCGQLHHPVKANQESCWAPSSVPSGAPWACRGARRGHSDLHQDS